MTVTRRDTGTGRPGPAGGPRRIVNVSRSRRRRVRSDRDRRASGAGPWHRGTAGKTRYCELRLSGYPPGPRVAAVRAAGCRAPAGRLHQARGLYRRGCNHNVTRPTRSRPVGHRGGPGRISDFRRGGVAGPGSRLGRRPTAGPGPPAARRHLRRRGRPSGPVRRGLPGEPP